MSRTAAALVAVLLLGGLAPIAAGGGVSDARATTTTILSDHSDTETSTEENTTSPHEAEIVAVYPNPVADGDRGEFVVVDLSTAPDTRYRIDDGESTVAIPNGTAEGRVAVTDAPALVRNLTDTRVVGVETMPSLANGGEQITLVRENETIASARYHDAPEGEVGQYDERGGITWEPIGATDRPVVSAGPGTARGFVLPDAPDVVVETIDDTENRVLLAGYTFTSERVARALERAAGRGVDVRVLLEGQPVDGLARREARLLDSMVDHGVTVQMMGGPRDRYAYHHAKYAVADDRALVLTENWKPSGTGGKSSRGWGAVVFQDAIVRGLAETFRADATGTGSQDWRDFRNGRTFTTQSPANGSYQPRHDAATLAVERTRLLVTPDNAGPEVTGLLDNATDSIDVIQMTVDGPDQRFVQAALRAARRGVDVRILLSDAWYVREDNQRLVEEVRERAEAEDLPLSARLADPGGRYEKIHAKGVVVDGDQALVGSLNWNDESVRENREVMLLLEGDDVGEYYADVFQSDWETGESGPAGSSLPIGSIVAVAGVVVLAVLVVRQVEFEDDVGFEPGDGDEK